MYDKGSIFVPVTGHSISDTGVEVGVVPLVLRQQWHIYA